MKNFTDLEQSKKLVEFLSFESADYHYIVQGEKSYFYPYSLSSDAIKHYDENIKYIPCWSLTALLAILPNNENISTTLSKGGYKISSLEYTNSWFVDYEDETDGLNNCVTSADNPIDACYEMILKLHKLKML